MIPIPWLAGGLALAVAVSGVSGFVAGIKWEKPKRIALEQGYRVAAAQAAGREAERLRTWTNAAKVAGERYAEHAQIADRSFDASLDRLRDAYSSSARLRLAAPAAEGCPGPSGPTAGDFLKQGEILAGLVRDADQTLAALKSCVSAWPR